MYKWSVGNLGEGRFICRVRLQSQANDYFVKHDASSHTATIAALFLYVSHVTKQAAGDAYNIKQGVRRVASDGLEVDVSRLGGNEIL